MPNVQTLNKEMILLIRRENQLMFLSLLYLNKYYALARRVRLPVPALISVEIVNFRLNCRVFRAKL